MIDITIVGSGATARASGEVLARAGFAVSHAFDIESGERSPIILGDVQGGFALARQAVETGRHVLISNPLSMTPERLSFLLESRKKSQALFIWNERRHHPGYRFVNGLMEADPSWRPRYLRQETLSQETTSGALFRWRALEALAAAMSFTENAPLSVSAAGTNNSFRGAPDLVCARLSFSGLDAVIQLGLGEAVERRETLIAAEDRKAYVDELNQSMPVRLIEDEARRGASGSARWLSCSTPSAEETARQQCLSFLDATLKTDLAGAEAALWLRSLGALDAIERSMDANGAATDVAVKEETPRLRLILNRSFAPTPPSVA